METELPLALQGPKARYKLSSKHAAKGLDRQKEAVWCRNPSTTVGSQSSGRYDAVNMRVVQQLLIPGMQHAKKADFRAEMFRVAGHRQQRLGAGAKQQTVDFTFILQG